MQSASRDLRVTKTAESDRTKPTSTGHSHSAVNAIAAQDKEFRAQKTDTTMCHSGD